MNPKQICFLVGSVAISGGTYVIFQHASYLQDQGYDVTLAVQAPFDDTTVAWHDCSAKLRLLPIAEARTGTYDLVIATWWKTALELADFDAKRHAYFVQSVESRFYPEAEVPLRALVDSTYRLPVSYITEARWIADCLESFGHKPAIVRNGIRKDIYSEGGAQIAPRPSGQPRILVEGHFNISFKNTALALRLARRAGAKDIWVLTGSPVRRLWGARRVFSRVPIHKTPEIYRSCDILLKLSTVEGMFGPPLEIFHCGGTAVVLDVSGHDEYIRHERNALVIRSRNQREIAEALRSLLNDRPRIAALKAGAREAARDWPDWASSSSAFEEWVSETLLAPESDREQIATHVRSAWDAYRHNEQSRLQSNPRIVWGYKLKSFAQRLSKRQLDWIARVIAMAEAAFPPKRIT